MTRTLINHKILNISGSVIMDPNKYWAVCLPDDDSMPQFEYATGQRGQFI